MFYTDEDVTPSVKLAEEIFGKNGNMLTGRNVINNAAIATREFGKLWYGDIDLFSGNFEQNALELSRRIGQTIYVFDIDRNNFNYSSALHTFTAQ